MALEYREFKIPKRPPRNGGFWTVISIERHKGLILTYLSPDGEHFTLYDTLTDPRISLDESVELFKIGFNPAVYEIFPSAPLDRDEVIEKAPTLLEIWKRTPRLIPDC